MANLTTEDLNIAMRLIIDSKDAITDLNNAEKAAKKYIKTVQQANNLSLSLGGKPVIPQSDIDAVKKFSNALGTVEPAAGKAGKGLWGLNNIFRTILGTLTAMGVFLVGQFIGNVLNKMIDSASQAEQALIKLSVAERSISQAGVDITPEELLGIADKVATSYETVSKIDAQKMISNLAVLTKDLRLSATEYEKMAMAIPLVAQQAGVSIDSATEQVITGLTKSGRGWADLGITVDAAIIKQKAVSMGLVESMDAYQNLTAEMKQQVEVLALLQILEDNVTNNKEKQEEYNNSLAGSQASLTAAWEDFLAALGKFAAPTLIQFLQSLTKTLTMLNGALDANAERTAQASAAMAMFFNLFDNFGIGQAGGQIGSVIEFLSDPVGRIRNAVNTYKQARKYQGTTPTDTATGIGSGALEATEDTADKMQEAVEKMNKEIIETELKAAQEREDIAIDLGRKLVDIETEYSRKRADATKEYSDKVRDINSSYQEDIAKVKQKQKDNEQKFRNDELQRELEFQNKMQEMKEDFLMDLEDALHARDARQILKLIKQYNLEKLQAERKHALDKDNAAKDYQLRQKETQTELKEAEKKRQDKLKEAQRDFADKMAKLSADEAAERAAAQLAAKRKLEDLYKQNRDRLALVAASLMAEYNMTGEWVSKMLGLYGKYYSNVAQVYSAMMKMKAGMDSIGTTSGVPQPATTTTKSPTSSTTTALGQQLGASGSGKFFAEGGTMLANRPTNVTFGDNGELEMATFTPIGRTGRDVNKVFSNLTAGGGAGGQVSIELLLSPDLESRIVSNTLNQTADVFVRMQRGSRNAGRL